MADAGASDTGAAEPSAPTVVAGRRSTPEWLKLVIAVTCIVALLLVGYAVVNRHEVLGIPQAATLTNSGCGSLGSVTATVDGTGWLLDPVTSWPQGWGQPRPSDRPVTVRGELRRHGDSATFTADADGVSVELRKRGDREFSDLSCAVS